MPLRWRGTIKKPPPRKLYGTEANNRFRGTTHIRAQRARAQSA